MTLTTKYACDTLVSKRDLRSDFPSLARNCVNRIEESKVDRASLHSGWDKMDGLLHMLENLVKASIHWFKEH